MKRCPNCAFPNIDTDRICFKCNTPLDTTPITSSVQTLVSQEIQAAEAQATVTNAEALDDLTPKSTMPQPIPFPKSATQPTFVPYKHVVSSLEVSSTSISEETCNSHHTPTDEVAPPTTTPPRSTTPTRILPKYKHFATLRVLLILLGCIQGIGFIGGGIILLLTATSETTMVLSFILMLLGLSSAIVSIILSFLFTWLNDVECNQRKQIELLNHLYHKS